MNLVLARIDNRLIHGQVLEAWVPFIHADCIVVANDKVAGMTFQRVLMEAAVPRRIRVVFTTIEKVPETLASEEILARRVLLLFATSDDALRAHQRGAEFTELNLGNMHGGKDKLRFSCTIALDAHDIENLESLEEDGVRIVSQCIPADRQMSWRKLIRHSGTSYGH